MWYYSKEDVEKLQEAKVLDKIISVSFKGNESINLHKVFQENQWTGLTDGYFEYENLINQLIGDTMLIRHPNDFISLSPKGLGISAVLERKGYEQQVKREVVKDLENKIILWSSVLALLVGLIALFI